MMGVVSHSLPLCSSLPPSGHDASAFAAEGEIHCNFKTGGLRRHSAGRLRKRRPGRCLHAEELKVQQESEVA